MGRHPSKNINEQISINSERKCYKIVWHMRKKLSVMSYKCLFRSCWFAVLSKSSISLFTFCLFVLTIIVDRALNSPVLIVE